LNDCDIVAHDCPDGCPTGQVDHSLERSAKLENGIAIGAITGAVVVVTGGVMLYINRLVGVSGRF
jgi:hypothetical protein